MSTPRVIFINRFYWPDEPATAQLLTDLAEGLACSGFSVTVLARRPSPATPLTASRNGVAIQRIPASTWGRRNLIGRAIDFGTFLRGARVWLRGTLQPSDVVVTMTDPPMLGPALRGVIKNSGASWVHWIQDIFPEVASAVSGRNFTRPLISWRNRAWREADACVVASNDMASIVRAQGVMPDRVAVSTNWAPSGLNPVDASSWRARHDCANKFILMYSGNLGRVHDFSAIVPLARDFADDVRVLFAFVGDGARRADLEREVHAAKLNNVRFFSAQPREALGETLSAGDLHLVSLRAGCEKLVFPSKLYGIAAVGRPVLAIAPANAELRRTVETNGFGAGFSHADVAAMAAYVRSLQADPVLRRELGEGALRFSRTQAQVGRAIAEWRGVLEPLIQLAARRASSAYCGPTP